MKHTPGPWSVHGDNKTLIGADHLKMMLAEVLWKHVCTEWGRPIEEAQANARLIAAAPDLLAFARVMEGYLEMKLDGWRRVDGLPDNHAIVTTAEMYLAQCRSAIAKAEGRAE